MATTDTASNIKYDICTARKRRFQQLLVWCCTASGDGVYTLESSQGGSNLLLETDPIDGYSVILNNTAVEIAVS